ncbi:ATP-dependent nuclease [Sulfuritalea hydrogenivorans]|uniref:ATP-dependent endonuclease family protein n=1 Tax=Sulfuritalea hydrogenivorans sk43H TaxID=1223802 RepID=W0SIE2_9PROT|nr:AAA family ATPase [Sulfuritalea hydrogenivorans]BAO29703.1 ATP-dependent endonuclease family protein [Sulfuritalea hydrogenivorans sk43H]
MQVTRIHIENFRGVKDATLDFTKHAVLLGDNNTGKTTALEALDLALGPDRLNRTPPVDEHDFYQGRYAANSKKSVLGDQGEVGLKAPDVENGEADATENGAGAVAPAEDQALKIRVDVTIVDLSEEQRNRFGDYIEFWDDEAKKLYQEATPEGVDADSISPALRVTFVGEYNPEEDDFEGKSFFTLTLADGCAPQAFTKKDKQVCGFLYLRSIRTGSRALSLERGSLLDIILRLKEVRPQMWEDAIGKLSTFSVAEDPSLGLSGVLQSINNALKKYVPREWGIEPHLKVSNLTRDHLRKVITAFIATGDGTHAAPFYRQGTGTINMLVLAMLSQIAEDKQNVIFAMEEPETAIPPYAQKRIIHEVRKLASQTLFTSHSPYVLEEFSLEETVILSRDSAGMLKQFQVSLPDSVKLKRYRQEFRTRFCEGLLARRVLIAEGATEASAFPVACRRLAELDPAKYSSMESLGICVVDAGGEGSIPDMAKLYKEIGKRTFALCDLQDAAALAQIKSQVEHVYMHNEKGIENLILKNTPQEAMERFCDLLQWPTDLAGKFPNPKGDVINALMAYFAKKKGDFGIAEYLAQCNEAEIPIWIRESCVHLRELCMPPPVPAEAAIVIGDIPGGDDDETL